MYKSSAYLRDITNNLDPKVKSNAASIKAVVEGFEKKVLNEPIEFKVGDYVVTVEAKGDRSDPDLYLTCTCNYWQYQGPEYHGVQNDYIYGKVRGTAEQPTKKDPNGTHKVCKHAYAVLRDFFGAN
tara:strand:+ start:508 stop:885 length:378 start_codon:yes stop_codon:yes gene_type:complete